MTGPCGALSLVGRFASASNGTFLAEDEDGVRWVYKPVGGESPLWDFPRGTLSRREVAAYALSVALGYDFVPLTVWTDGPLGEGSAQVWVGGEETGLIALLAPEDLSQHWMPVLAASAQDGRPVVLAHRDDENLRRIALFDALLNNSDRKASHVIAQGERLWAIDHGVVLHADDKLRTVLWGWAGRPLTVAEQEIVSHATSLREPPAGIAGREWEALNSRADRLLKEGVFPAPNDRWPPIPWPPL